MMLPPRAIIPNVPLTDTEVIVYFFQSLSRAPVALRLYARQWGPAGIVDVLNSHRNIEGGYLRNTCSVKCITSIRNGKEKHGDEWEDWFRNTIENADDVTATDMIQFDHDDLEGIVDYDIRELNKGLKKHPKEGVDGGIFTRCVKYCIENDVSYHLSNVHELALMLQSGLQPEMLQNGIEPEMSGRGGGDGEEVFGQTQEGVE
jgi:hypothetical protein